MHFFILLPVILLPAQSIFGFGTTVAGAMVFINFEEARPLCEHRDVDAQVLTLRHFIGGACGWDDTDNFRYFTPLGILARRDQHHVIEIETRKLS